MDARDAFLERARHGGIVPVLRQVVTDADTPVAAFAKIARPPFAFLYESLVGGERWARYTFLGTEPREAWRYRGTQIERWTPANGWEPAGATRDPLTHLAERMRALPTVALPGLPRFTGGAVGYLGYDLVRSIEKLPAAPPTTSRRSASAPRPPCRWSASGPGRSAISSPGSRMWVGPARVRR